VAETKEKEKEHAYSYPSERNKKGLQDVLDDGMHWHRIKFHRIVDCSADFL
jgi:hypothetical protein